MLLVASLRRQHRPDPLADQIVPNSDEVKESEDLLVDFFFPHECSRMGWRCLPGFEAVSKTPQNILRTGECVINLPSDRQVDAINRLSLVTGSNLVPQDKGFERMSEIEANILAFLAKS